LNAQKPKVYVKLCHHEVAKEDPRYVTCELTAEEIIKCKTLKANDPNFTIKSFQFSYQTPYKTISPEIIIEGNEISSEMLAHIKRYKPNKIWINKIELVNPDGKTQWTRALTINIIK
jgi:HKD family nuclease